VEGCEVQNVFQVKSS